MSSVPHNAPNGHLTMSQYDWDTDRTTVNAPAFDPAQRWRSALGLASAAARRRFPHSHGRIDKAVELLLDGKVILHQDKTATVTSSDGTTTYQVNGSCPCPDYERAPEHYCKHTLSVAILRKASVLAAEFAAASAPVTVPAAGLDPEAVPVVEAAQHAPLTPEPGIATRYLTQIHGKTFIRCDGLMALGRQRGIQALVVVFTYNDATLSLAQATLTLHDGSVWTECADSTPENVPQQVKAHWRRMSLTRATARVLRRALAIDLVAVEELGE